ncbi:ClC family H(+)/Cl(-) exchange transporter [uncultured Bilophila sp.]|uniref:ClC family H(+)/Cl(-) exchange transporter n=1 Tax=uncultured Bilophila sp. TaxID=529385 RepID=UPI0026DAC5FB|nr:ClC family H(+)/Cl(-) exchange transporter [uncultured Bilophila sp.]
MKRKTKVRIARLTRHVPILREMQALRNESALRLIVQAAFVGGCTGGVIGVFRWLYDHGNARIVAALRHGADNLTTALIVFGTLILLALVVGQLVRKEPLISGSGIPQMELALAGLLPFPWLRIVTAKFVGTLLSLSGGLSVGREGPSIQMGAAVGCGFGQLFQRLTGEDPSHAPRFLIAGSVAGLTAAFGAPFAGMLFAFEEVKTIVTVPLLLFTGVASFSAWFVINILFGFGLVFPFADIPSLNWPQMWIPLLIGVGTGLFSAAYNTALLGVTRLHDRQKLVPAHLKPLLPFLLSGILLYTYPQVLVGLGYSTSDLGGLTANGPLALAPLAFLLLVKVCFSILSFASGVPGGLLMPMLAIGSMVGAVAGTLFVGSELSAAPQLPAYLVLGMTGLFSGTVRAPLTGTALVAEMSGAFQCLPEMAVVAFISTVVANKAGSPPVYDSLKRRILVNGNASSSIN